VVQLNHPVSSPPALFFIRPFYSSLRLLFSCLSITISSSPAVARFNATPCHHLAPVLRVPHSCLLLSSPRLDPCLPVIRLQLFAFLWRVLFISLPPAAQPFRRLPWFGITVHASKVSTFSRALRECTLNSRYGTPVACPNITDNRLASH